MRKSVQSSGAANVARTADHDAALHLRSRICHLIGHIDFGGAERQVVNLVNAMAHLRPVLILTNPQRTNDLLAEVDERVNVIHIPCRLALWPLDARRLAVELRRLQIEVLHTHMFWPNLWGSLAATLAGTPVLVTTEHGLNPWKRPWHRWLERKVISKRAACRICVTEEIRNARRTLDGVADDRLRVLPNGTPPRHVRRGAFGSPPRLLCVGRLVPAKDYVGLLRAARLLAERAVHFELQIAGDGSLRASLEQLRSDLGLQQHVQFLGARSDIGELMDASDIFVMSSTREGQPVALLEAMAAAMPIVATAVGGIPQAVTDGRDAVLVPPGNPERLAAAIENLIKDPRRAAALGYAAHRTADERFSIEAISRAHLRLYCDLLGAKS